MGPSWFGILWYQRSRLHRISMRLSMRRWLRQSICSNLCMLVSRCLGFFCRYRRWPHYLTWHRHQYVPKESGLIEWSCMVQRLRLRLMVMDRLWNRVWISFRNLLTIFLKEVIRVLIQYLLRLSGILRNLRDLCSYRLTFWFYLNKGQRFPFRWCSDLWRSCWQHLPFLRLIIQGGIIICKFQF